MIETVGRRRPYAGLYTNGISRGLSAAGKKQKSENFSALRFPNFRFLQSVGEET
jgi:hypothetical protein